MTPASPRKTRIDPRLCAICRGRGFCGLSYCPLLAQRMAMAKLRRVYGSRELYGSSPPSVFVGRIGYPYVNVGPSLPPVVGDTSIYDLPEKWIGLSLEKILDYRWSLITGSARVKVDEASRDRLVLELQELVLSTRPVEAELVLEKPPKPLIAFSEYEPPQGPRAKLEKLRIVGNPWVPRVVDRVYSDTDMRATEAVLELYKAGVPVTHIQKLFSIGALGTRRYRRLVPTRWSITAVDDIVSRSLVEKIKGFDEIDSIMVYARRYYDNLFIAILIPGKWSFEWMEAWWPGSTWNPGAREVIVEGDYEGYRGRTSYPEIGGCYYASRLAVAEHLYRIRRQAEAILLREIYPGFNLPIGVWFVRENLRAMFRGKPVLVTSEMSDVLAFLEKETRLGAQRWIMESRLLQRRLYVKRLTEVIKRGS
ncbi:MAG: Nre family DNA repair protein [Pyrodictiaceae archaeon]